MITKTKAKTITIGELIRKERERKCMTITEVANISGVSTSTISETENNVHTPKVGTLIKILKGIE